MMERIKQKEDRCMAEFAEQVIWKKGKVPYLTFPVFEQMDWLTFGFSTRRGGVSEGYFQSMNLGFGRGDLVEHVEKNYERFCEAIGVKPEHLVFSDQIHETTVLRVGAEHRQGSQLTSKKLKGVDGLITNEPEVVLVTSYADCVPLFFADEEHHAIGASHSGWRGTVGKIGEKTVEQMKQEFGTDPSQLKAVIGPSICQSCYEVSEDVAEQFEQLFPDDRSDVLEPGKPGKYQLNLWKANERILVQAGLKRENICISGYCTCHHPDLLFSHRATNGKRGNMCGFLSIRGENAAGM